MLVDHANWPLVDNTIIDNSVDKINNSESLNSGMNIEVIISIDDTLNKFDKIFQISEISIEILEYLLTSKGYKLAKLSSNQDKGDIDESTYGMIVNLVDSYGKIIKELCLTCPKISQKGNIKISLIIPFGEKVINDDSEIMNQFKKIHHIIYLENNGDPLDNTIIHNSLLHSPNRP